MLPLNPTSYEDAVKRFNWNIPQRYNIGVDACAKWAEQDPGRPALLHVDQHGKAQYYSFGEMHESSNRLARLFLALGAKPGDRIGILLPQSPETAYAHIAAYKIGCIAIPLFTLFGAEALRYRLGDSGALLVVTNAEGAAKLAQRCLDLADYLVARDQAPAAIERGGRKAHPLELERGAATLK